MIKLFQSQELSQEDNKGDDNLEKLLNYDDFKGALTESTFDYLYILTKQKLDFYTFNRIDYSKEYLKKIAINCLKTLIFSLKDKMDMISPKVEENGKIIQSEHIGEQSETYYIPTFSEIEKFIETQDKYIVSIIKTFFAHTSLMYRGI